MGSASRGWTCRRPNCGPSSQRARSPRRSTPEGRRAERAGGAGAGVAAAPKAAPGRKLSTQAAFGEILAEIGRGQGELTATRRAHRHHQPGRDGLDQSRPLGEPPRHLRPAHEATTCSATPSWRARSAGACRRRASTSSSASPSRTCSCCWAALGLTHGAVRRAAAAGRHGLRSVRQPRPRCADLCLLPGCALPAGLHAVRA